MEALLTPVEARVVGCLLEKDITTPEYYPMSLNALVNACNQKSNRDPVVSFDEASVEQNLEALRHKGLTGILTGPGNRVPKYSHRLSERLNLGRREHALLTELLLRGQQTPGELRNRAARMYEFSDLDETEACLRAMMERELVTQMPHRPGTKEVRWAHLLCGPPAEEEAAPLAAPPREDRIAALEAEVARLRAEWDAFKKQFE